MPRTPQKQPPLRPARVGPSPVPPLPEVDSGDADAASVTYSHYRTSLSNRRTGLSEHRTDLSEFRTDLSADRTDLSMHRTGLSFQRTRLSADRTLMSVIRTSLSLIGFGFTIAQVFEKLHDAGQIENPAAPRNFGVALIGIGVLMLVVGLIYQVQFMLELRRTRQEMATEGLIHGVSRFPVSFTSVTAFALLLLGVAAVVSLVFRISPFG